MIAGWASKVKPVIDSRYNGKSVVLTNRVSWRNSVIELCERKVSH